MKALYSKFFSSNIRRFCLLNRPPRRLKPVIGAAPVIKDMTCDIGPYARSVAPPFIVTFMFPLTGVSLPYSALSAFAVVLYAPDTAAHECPASFTASAYLNTICPSFSVAPSVQARGSVNTIDSALSKKFCFHLLCPSDIFKSSIIHNLRLTTYYLQL